LKAKDHFMPLYVGDFLAATATWTGPERGLYLQLLMFQWSAGELPSDIDRLARAVNYTTPEFKVLWPTLRSKFQNGDGKLTNLRMEEIRAKNLDVQKSRMKASHAGVEARRQMGLLPPVEPPDQSPVARLVEPNDAPIVEPSVNYPNRTEPNRTEPRVSGRAPQAPACRLPPDFGLTIERINYAIQYGVEPGSTMQNFTDYWKAASGPRARKHDWDATWRIWCRKESEQPQKAKLQSKAPTTAELEAREKNA
jgi:uncharacterized protein YdaU (DUF1376 family)